MTPSYFSQATSKTVTHYYGDTVRKLFLAIGLLMLVTFPFFKERLDVPIYLSLGAILALDVIAGAISPRVRWLAYVESFVAFAGCAVFEYLAIRDISVTDPLFWTNQIIAVLFFFALYYSMKTARSTVLKQQVDRGE